jgi:hypothetical protein
MRSRKNQRRRNQSQARKSVAGGKNRYNRPDAPGGFTVRLGQLQQGADAAANFSKTDGLRRHIQFFLFHTNFQTLTGSSQKNLSHA